MAEGYIQANVVILPSKYAYDFLKFCFRNPKTYPLLDVSEVGAHSFPYYGPYADIRTDVPKYRIYEHGQLIKEVDDITDLYTEDMVSFLIGCSFTFEHALLEAGLPVRHIEEGHNVPMYRTNIPAESSGYFKGNITVSMRPMTMTQAIKATEITSHLRMFMARRFILVHQKNWESLISISLIMEKLSQSNLTKCLSSGMWRDTTICCT